MQISGDLKIQYFHISDDIFIAFGATLPPFCGRTQVKHNISNSALSTSPLPYWVATVYILFSSSFVDDSFTAAIPAFRITFPPA